MKNLLLISLLSGILIGCSSTATTPHGLHRNVRFNTLHSCLEDGFCIYGMFTTYEELLEKKEHVLYAARDAKGEIITTKNKGSEYIKTAMLLNHESSLHPKKDMKSALLVIEIDCKSKAVRAPEIIFFSDYFASGKQSRRYAFEKHFSTVGNRLIQETIKEVCFKSE